MHQLFREARRTSPSIIYMPHISHWWESTNETTRATFLTLLEDLPSSSPVLILATSEFPLHEVPVQVIRQTLSNTNLYFLFFYGSRYISSLLTLVVRGTPKLFLKIGRRPILGLDGGVKALEVLLSLFSTKLFEIN